MAPRARDFRKGRLVHEGRTEVVYIADVDEIPRPPKASFRGLTLARSVGINGTRPSATLGAEVVGYIEVESREEAGRLPRNGGWADIGNPHVAERYRGQGVGSWLVGQAAEWLQLARLDRLLDYAWPEQPEYDAFLRKLGFRELTRTQRGWRRRRVQC